VTRAVCAGVLLVALAALETGCGWGYVTYFEPERRGAREVLHQDPYAHPPPPSAVELAAGSLTVGCTNIRKFLLLPIPWFRWAFNPDELEIELAFSGEPNLAVIDVAAVALTLEGKTILPSRVSYTGRRPAPMYLETIVLPTRDRYKLEDPLLVTYVFKTEASDASEFRMSVGEVTVDGVRTLIPPLAFSREGQFVVYLRAKKKAAASGGIDPESDEVF
jgi:hypothetical protein